MNTIYTIGHSNHPIATFIAMLQSFDIKVLADVRSMPGSKRWPQYNRSALMRSLADAGISYIHFPDLGGKRKDTTDGTQPFSGYSGYMQTDQFKTAINELLQTAQKERTVYMCAESDWRHCHRSMISEYLHQHKVEVFHISGIGEGKPHPDALPAGPQQGSLF